MKTSACVLVTRPLADAQRWVAHLQAAGLPALAMPLLEIAPLLPPSEMAAWWQRLPQYAALMFVSGNAVEYFFAGGSGPWPSGLRCLAPGPGTGARLRSLGVAAALIDEPAPDAVQFDSEALWQVIGQRPWAGQQVLLVRGNTAHGDGAAGRNWLAEQLERAGASVASVAVYERRAPQFSRQQHQRIVDASQDGSLWLFSSSEAISHLPAGLDWRAARALATHPRIAQAARMAGFAEVIQSRPALPEVLASIKSVFHE
ncbi:MAG: uroporphyrinogen-III synthase [Betaproteobacteria bacterium]